MSNASPRYSVVVPVYKNEATLDRLVARLSRLTERLPAPLEVVFVVDGSPDGSLSLLRRLLTTPRGFASQLISLSRNFGSFSAIRTGLDAAKGQYIAVVAADLQEPPELVERFFELLDGGEYEVAFGVRESRADPPGSLLLSQLFWRLFSGLIHRDMPRGGVDVFACSRTVAAELVQFKESHTSLVGLLFWVGFPRVAVPYQREARPEGRSGWSMRRKVRYLTDSIFSFTDVPVLLITIVGAVGVFLSAALGTIVLIAWLLGRVTVAVYTPIMLALVFTASSVLFSLGVIGSYVWRAYENTKRRPDAITMSHERIPTSPHDPLSSRNISESRDTPDAEE